MRQYLLQLQHMRCATPMNILTETSPEIPKNQNRKTDNSKVAGPCRTGNSDNSNYWSTSGALFVKLPAGPSQSCRARVLPTPVANKKNGNSQSCRGPSKVAGPKNRKIENRKTEKDHVCMFCFFCVLCFAFVVFLGEVSVSMFIGAGQPMMAGLATYAAPAPRTAVRVLVQMALSARRPTEHGRHRAAPRTRTVICIKLHK